MRYYIAVYFKDDKWWKRSAAVYPSWDSAYSARMEFIAVADVDPYIMGNKVQVWTKSAWEKLPCGFKHPDDRTHAETHPSRKESRQGIFDKDFNELQTDLAQALREAGL